MKAVDIDFSFDRPYYLAGIILIVVVFLIAFLVGPLWEHPATMIAAGLVIGLASGVVMGRTIRAGNFRNAFRCLAILTALELALPLFLLRQVGTAPEALRAGWPLHLITLAFVNTLALIIAQRRRT